VQYLTWLISLVALVWLIVVAFIIIRRHQVLSPSWTWIPLLIAVAIRLLIGTAAWMVAVVAIVLLISERRHLQHKLLEALALVSGLLVILLIFFITDIPTQSGIGGVLVFWISWELHFIGGEDAMILITCILLWPNIEFLLAYLTAGLICSIGIRFKEGGWLKGHIVPIPLVIAFSGVIYLGYQLFLLAVKK
jgi:hypothetical protein